MVPNFYKIWIADGKPRSGGGGVERGAAYESKTTGNDSTQQASRDGIVEGSGAGGGGGSRGRDGAVGSGKQDVSTGESLRLASREAAGATYPLVPFWAAAEATRAARARETSLNCIVIDLDWTVDR